MHEQPPPLQKMSLSDSDDSSTPKSPHRPSLNASSTLATWAGPIVLAYLLVGTAVFCATEGWSPRDSLYFCLTALTTVGYGDLVPKTDAAKLFCCAYVVTGVSLFSASLGVVLGRMQAKVSSTRLFTAIGSSAATGHGRHKASIMHSAASLAALVLSGAVFAHLSEGWSALDSMYWSIITSTSVGFGDKVISSEARTAGMLYMVVAVVGFASLAAGLVRTFAELEVERQLDEFVREGVTSEMIEEMDGDASGAVERAEFLSYFLVRTGKVEKADLRRIDALFSALDADGSGRIDAGDVKNAGGGGGHGSAELGGARGTAHATTPDSPPACSEAGLGDHLLGPRREGAASHRHRHASAYHHPAFRPLESAALRHAAAALEEATTPRAVDAVLAAGGCGGALAVLHAADYTGLFPTKLFAPPMLGSTILLFGGSKPPPPAMLLLGTAGAFAIGTAMHWTGGLATPAIAHCLVAAALLLWFKLSRAFYLPAAGFAALLAQNHHGAAHRQHMILMPHPHADSTSLEASLSSALLYLISPWGAGHLLLYACAVATARFRRQVRGALIRSEGARAATGHHGEARLREIFERYDSAGDGFLDHLELKLAIRVATGDEVQLDDCERLVRALDTDGNGALDFHEFKQALCECSSASHGDEL
eukprot:Transcript_27767.p1 GENE.Transcript_27767~~Transcript_27767.p1  ORF type:complete len:652 (+),score=232.50 Transcript_27767:94-2049(+)